MRDFIAKLWNETLCFLTWITEDKYQAVSGLFVLILLIFSFILVGIGA